MHASGKPPIEDQLGVPLGEENLTIRTKPLGLREGQEHLSNPGQSLLAPRLSPREIAKDPGRIEQALGGLSGRAGGRKKEAGILDGSGAERGGRKIGRKSEKKGKRGEGGCQNDCRVSTVSLFP
jgi:hypothetical protein